MTPPRRGDAVLGDAPGLERLGAHLTPVTSPRHASRPLLGVPAGVAALLVVLSVIRLEMSGGRGHRPSRPWHGTGSGSGRAAAPGRADRPLTERTPEARTPSCTGARVGLSGSAAGERPASPTRCLDQVPDVVGEVPGLREGQLDPLQRGLAVVDDDVRAVVAVVLDQARAGALVTQAGREVVEDVLGQVLARPADVAGRALVDAVLVQTRPGAGARSSSMMLATATTPTARVESPNLMVSGRSAGTAVCTMWGENRPREMRESGSPVRRRALSGRCRVPVAGVPLGQHAGEHRGQALQAGHRAPPAWSITQATAARREDQV